MKKSQLLLYKAQVRKNETNALSQLLQAVSSFCHEECLVFYIWYSGADKTLRVTENVPVVLQN